MGASNESLDIVVEKRFRFISRFWSRISPVLSHIAGLVIAETLVLIGLQVGAPASLIAKRFLFYLCVMVSHVPPLVAFGAVVIVLTFAIVVMACILHVIYKRLQLVYRLLEKLASRNESVSSHQSS